MDLLKDRLGLDIFQKLLNVNVRSISSILLLSKNELMQSAQLNAKEVGVVLKECSEIVLRDKISTAKGLSKWRRLSTGCASIDKITKGGIPLNGICEIFGTSGVGKTQICLQLAITAQLSELNKSVVYICTEDIFPSNRFNELANIFTKKLETSVNFEDNVYISHVAEVEQLKKCLFVDLPKLAAVKNVDLVIIDSIAGVFRSENLNVNYTNRSYDLISIANRLNKLSEKYNFGIVCVNQVADNVETGYLEACLGLTWSNIITTRFLISRCKNILKRQFEIIFASDLPNASCEFSIESDGLV